MISPERIAEITALAEAASPGPWRVCIDDSGDRPLRVPSIQAPEELDCAIVHWDGFWQEHWQSARGEKEWNANAAFIAAARTAVPELLAECEELRARVAVLEGALEPFAREFAGAGASHLPDDMLWTVANGEDAAKPFVLMSVTVGHFRRARTALKEQS